MPYHRSGRPLGWFLLASLLLLAVGCARTSDLARVYAPESGPQWTPLLEGVDLARTHVKQPVRQEVYALRIDLHTPGLRLQASPDNGEAPGETDGMKTSTYLRRAGCDLAINATPFDPVRDDEGLPTDIVGLHVHRGQVVSPPDAKFGALMIGAGNRVWIEDQSELVEADDPTSGALEVVGGFNWLLRSGENVGDANPPRHPRTAVGVSRDGRYLVAVIIDGRQAGYSMGATLSETAEWMRWAGAHDALNLDGGGSTALVLRDTRPGRHQDKQTRVRVINRPIHKNIPGNERVNGNSLGVFVGNRSGIAHEGTKARDGK